MSILFQYLIWHFFDVPRGLLKTWRNFLKFNLNYFSIPLLTKTLFSHWRRYSWSYGQGFDIWRYIGVFFSNLTSRFFGAAARFFLIIIGLFFELLLIVLGGLSFFVWLFLPVCLILSLIFGFKIIF